MVLITRDAQRRYALGDYEPAQLKAANDHRTTPMIGDALVVSAIDFDSAAPEADMLIQLQAMSESERHLLEIDREFEEAHPDYISAIAGKVQQMGVYISARIRFLPVRHPVALLGANAAGFKSLEEICNAIAFGGELDWRAEPAYYHGLRLAYTQRIEKLAFVFSS